MTIAELLAATGLTANDLVPIWDAEAAQNVEPTQKVTATQLAAAVKVLASLVNTTEMNTAIAQSTAGGARYFKSQDGTLIQWGDYTGPAVTASALGALYMVTIHVNISFPIEFVGAVPAVSILKYGGYGAPFASSVYRDKIASVDLARPTAGSITPTFYWIAIGRWK